MEGSSSEVVASLFIFITITTTLMAERQMGSLGSWGTLIGGGAEAPEGWRLPVSTLTLGRTEAVSPLTPADHLGKVSPSLSAKDQRLGL